MASELNVSTQQVQSFLEDIGKKVRGPSTVIGVSAAAKVRGRFRALKPSHGVEPAGPALASVASVVAVSPVPPVSTVSTLGNSVDDVAGRTSSQAVGAVGMPRANGSGSPSAGDQRVAVSQSLFLPPVAPAAPVTVTRTTGAFANPFAVSAPKPAPVRSAPNLSTIPMQTRGVANRVAPIPPPPLVAEPQPDYDAQWERRGISPTDREQWIVAGLRPAEAELADRCQSAGIAPSELAKKLSGRTTLQRLRDGEAITSVWARIREAEQQPRRAGTKLTGRFQLS